MCCYGFCWLFKGISFVEISQTNFLGVELENLYRFEKQHCFKNFSNKEWSEFWISNYEEYPQLSLKTQ